LVYSDAKTGKSAQLTIDAAKVPMLLNYKVSDVIEGSEFGLPGYKLRITGGSDSSGFPLRKSIQGSIKTKILRRSKAFAGKHRRTSVRGGTISADTMQINAVIVEYGSKPVGELFPESKKEKTEKKEAQ
jgi:small subunit ribosomal protein S6e